MKLKFDPKVILFLKIAFFIYILTSPFIPPKNIQFLNNIFVKILFLILIVLAVYIDIQLAIIMMIAFLVFIINLNKDKIISIKKESFGSQPENIYKSPEMTEVKTPPFFDTMVKMPDTQCNDMMFYRNQISNDLFDLYIDEKVKPYENTIRKLTSPDHLENAQSNSIDFL